MEVGQVIENVTGNLLCFYFSLKNQSLTHAIESEKNEAMSLNGNWPVVLKGKLG